MKKKHFRIAALVIVFAMLASFAACGGNSEDTTTTTAAADAGTTADAVNGTENTTATTLAGSDDDDSTTASVQNTDNNETPTGNNDAPTNAPIQNNAPINGAKDAVLNYYNTTANAAKKYSGTVKIARAQGTTSTLDEISIESLRGKAEEMLPNDYPQNKSASYTAGKSSDGDTLSRMLPPDKADYTSKLTASGVKSAVCTAQGDGCKIVITLVEEKGNDINFKPPYHGSCMDTLSITSEDIKPFTLKSAEITYVGATITATVDAQGRLTSLKISEPVRIQGKLSFVGIPLINAKITGTWKQEFTLTY
ncbi:MAG: hypothetical protein GX051_08825 [Clostridiales bacterium]|nr:hypothetical protein [Clostridiales bacterium]